MNRLLLRSVALLLIPCLLADPFRASAAEFFYPAPATLAATTDYSSRFAEEALAARLLARTRETLGRIRFTSRFLDEYASLSGRHLVIFHHNSDDRRVSGVSRLNAELLDRLFRVNQNMRVTLINRGHNLSETDPPDANGNIVSRVSVPPAAAALFSTIGPSILTAALLHEVYTQILGRINAANPIHTILLELVDPELPGAVAFGQAHKVPVRVWWHFLKHIHEPMKHKWLRRVNSVAVVSAFGQRVLESYGISSTVLDPLSDLDFWSRERVSDQDIRTLRVAHGIPENARIVLSVTTNPYKNPFVMLPWIAALEEEGMENITPVVILANADEEQCWKVRALIVSEMGMDAFVLPAQESAQMRAWYAATTVLVAYGLHEALGKGTIEAQSMGTPVIATRVEGHPEAVHPTKGMLIDVQDPDAKGIALLRRLLTDTEFHQDMARVGQEYVKRRFGYDHIPEFTQWILHGDKAAYPIERTLRKWLSVLDAFVHRRRAADRQDVVGPSAGRPLVRLDPISIGLALLAYALTSPALGEITLGAPPAFGLAMWAVGAAFLIAGAFSGGDSGEDKHRLISPIAKSLTSRLRNWLGLMIGKSQLSQKDRSLIINSMNEILDRVQAKLFNVEQGHFPGMNWATSQALMKNLWSDLAEALYVLGFVKAPVPSEMVRFLVTSEDRHITDHVKAVALRALWDHDQSAASQIMQEGNAAAEQQGRTLPNFAHLTTEGFAHRRRQSLPMGWDPSRARNDLEAPIGDGYNIHTKISSHLQAAHQLIEHARKVPRWEKRIRERQEGPSKMRWAVAYGRLLKDQSREHAKELRQTWEHIKAFVLSFLCRLAGDAFFKLGRHRAAEWFYDRAIGLDPENARAFEGLGAVCLARGAIDEALAYYGRSFELKPRQRLDSLLHQLKVKGYAEDIQNHLMTLVVDLQNGHAHLALGMFYEDNGEFDAALRHLNAAVRYGADQAMAFFRRGNVRLDLGNRAGAIADYTAAISHHGTETRLDLSASMIYFNRAVVYRQLGDEEEAERDLQRSFEAEQARRDASTGLKRFPQAPLMLFLALTPLFLGAAPGSWPAALMWMSLPAFGVLATTVTVKKFRAANARKTGSRRKLRAPDMHDPLYRHYRNRLILLGPIQGHRRRMTVARYMRGGELTHRQRSRILHQLAIHASMDITLRQERLMRALNQTVRPYSRLVRNAKTDAGRPDDAWALLAGMRFALSEKGKLLGFLELDLLKGRIGAMTIFASDPFGRVEPEFLAAAAQEILDGGRTDHADVLHSLVKKENAAVRKLVMRQGWARTMPDGGATAVDELPWDDFVREVAERVDERGFVPKLSQASKGAISADYARVILKEHRRPSETAQRALRRAYRVVTEAEDLWIERLTEMQRKKEEIHGYCRAVALLAEPPLDRGTVEGILNETTIPQPETRERLLRADEAFVRQEAEWRQTLRSLKRKVRAAGRGYGRRLADASGLPYITVMGILSGKQDASPESRALLRRGESIIPLEDYRWHAFRRHLTQEHAQDLSFLRRLAEAAGRSRSGVEKNLYGDSIPSMDTQRELLAGYLKVKGLPLRLGPRELEMLFEKDLLEKRFRWSSLSPRRIVQAYYTFRLKSSDHPLARDILDGPGHFGPGIGLQFKDALVNPGASEPLASIGAPLAVYIVFSPDLIVWKPPFPILPMKPAGQNGEAGKTANKPAYVLRTLIAALPIVVLPLLTTGAAPGSGLTELIVLAWNSTGFAIAGGFVGGLIGAGAGYAIYRWKRPKIQVHAPTSKKHKAKKQNSNLPDTGRRKILWIGGLAVLGASSGGFFGWLFGASRYSQEQKVAPPSSAPAAQPLDLVKLRTRMIRLMEAFAAELANSHNTSMSEQVRDLLTSWQAMANPFGADPGTIMAVNPDLETADYDRFILKKVSVAANANAWQSFFNTIDTTPEQAATYTEILKAVIIKEAYTVWYLKKNFDSVVARNWYHLEYSRVTQQAITDDAQRLALLRAHPLLASYGRMIIATMVYQEAVGYVEYLRYLDNHGINFETFDTLNRNARPELSRMLTTLAIPLVALNQGMVDESTLKKAILKIILRFPYDQDQGLPNGVVILSLRKIAADVLRHESVEEVRGEFSPRAEQLRFLSDPALYEPGPAFRKQITDSSGKQGRLENSPSGPPNNSSRHLAVAA